MEETELEEPIIREKRRSKLDNPDAIQFIIQNKNDGKSYDEIREGLEVREWGKPSNARIDEVYNSAIAKSILTHNTALEKFEDMSFELNRMNKTRMRILEGLLNNIETYKNELDEIADLPKAIKAEKLIKLYPQLISALSEFNKVLDSYMNQQDKVQQERQRTQLTTSQVMDKINDYLPEIEKQLIEKLKREGKYVG